MSSVYPAYAGVILLAFRLLFFNRRLSRIRGGDPDDGGQVSFLDRFIPHTRGWSSAIIYQPLLLLVYPAYAGVILHSSGNNLNPFSLSRIRGGDPLTEKKFQTQKEFIPHTRGWSLITIFTDPGDVVYPAYAGVILKMS